ncbi:unnamed protein product, partial [Musa banksii]
MTSRGERFGVSQGWLPPAAIFVSWDITRLGGVEGGRGGDALPQRITSLVLQQIANAPGGTARTHP